VTIRQAHNYEAVNKVVKYDDGSRSFEELAHVACIPEEKPA
jgi:hypothetical protein